MTTEKFQRMVKDWLDLVGCGEKRTASPGMHDNDRRGDVPLNCTTRPAQVGTREGFAHYFR
jgi:hypothetical protein